MRIDFLNDVTLSLCIFQEQIFAHGLWSQDNAWWQFGAKCRKFHLIPQPWRMLKEKSNHSNFCGPSKINRKFNAVAFTIVSKQSYPKRGCEVQHVSRGKGCLDWPDCLIGLPFLGLGAGSHSGMFLTTASTACPAAMRVSQLGLLK